MDDSSRGAAAAPPFLIRDTAALLSPLAGKSPSLEGWGDSGGANRGLPLSEEARQLRRELVRRQACGETRLYASDLITAMGIPASSLAAAFTSLRAAGLVDWDDAGPYLYLKTEDDGLAQIYSALQEAGLVVNSANADRMREWVAVLGLKDVLDEIALCRSRGGRRFGDYSLALDRACNYRRRVSPFGTLAGRGVVGAHNQTVAAVRGETPVTAEPLANAAAYDPVPPSLVAAWVNAHPGLYTEPPPAPPKAAGRGAGRPATQAGAYEPVPEEAVRRWAEAFPEEYERYQREYRELSGRAQTGPFRRRGSGYTRRVDSGKPTE